MESFLAAIGSNTHSAAAPLTRIRSKRRTADSVRDFAIACIGAKVLTSNFLAKEIDDQYSCALGGDPANGVCCVSFAVRPVFRWREIDRANGKCRRIMRQATLMARIALLQYCLRSRTTYRYKPINETLQG